MMGQCHLVILAVATSLVWTSSEAAAEVFDKELAVDEQVIISNEDLPKGWVVASDPELVKFGNRWWMFFNSIQLDFEKGLPIHVLAANLPPDAPLSSAPDKWTVLPNPVISPGPKGSWDERTIETTKYVFGYDATLKKFVGRLYYVGWPVQKNGQKHYQIGFSEWSDKRKQWIKRKDPVATGTEKWEQISGTSFIGDQSVYYEPGSGRGGADGVWHMWYQAVSKPKDGGVSIVHLTSKDGVSWGNKKRLTHKVPFSNQFVKTGPFSLDVFVKNGRY